MKRIVAAGVLLLGATLTAQANYIPARTSHADFYTAIAGCESALVRPLTREQSAYNRCMLKFGWRYIYVAPTD